MSLLDLIRSRRPLDEDERKHMPRLMAEAERVWRGSQGPTYADYLEMEHVERVAFILARDKLRALDAQRQGLATMGPLGAALAGADADGGEAVAAVTLATAHRDAMAAIEAEERALRGTK